MTDVRMRNPFRRFRRLVAALLIPFVLVWSIMIPRQALAFAPVGAAPIVIVGGLASGAVVPLVVGAAIAGVAYWVFQDLMSLDEVRVPAVDGAAGAVPVPTDGGVPQSAPAETFYTASVVYGDESSIETSLDAARSAACSGLSISGASAIAGFCGVTAVGVNIQNPVLSGSTCTAQYQCQFASTQGSWINFNFPTTYTSASGCGTGYTLGGSTCTLTNPHAAIADNKQDFTRSGTGMAPISGDQAGGLSATTMTTTNADDTVVVAGKDSAGNAMQGKIIALPSGGSKVELKTQKVDAGGQTYVETQTFQTSSAGDVVSATKTAAQTSLTYDPTTNTYTENPNPSDSYSPTPATQQAIQFPSDYARQGEAASAAQSISNTLGPKLDLLLAPSPAPDDPALPPSSQFDDAFFNGTFTNLLGWSVPTHASQCPTASMVFYGSTLVMDAHCAIIDQFAGVLAGIAAAMWTIAALLIVLGA